MFRTTAALMLSAALLTTPALAADAPVADSAIATASSIVVTTTPAPLTRPTSRVREGRSLVLPSLYLSLSTLQAYDVYSTLSGVRGGAVESNPLMRGVVGHPAAFVALKVGVTASSIYAAEHLWRQNRKKSAVLLMIASNGLMAYVAAHNASVTRGMR